VNRAIQVIPETKVLLELKGILAILVHKDFKERLENKERQELKVSKDFKEMSVLRVQ